MTKRSSDTFNDRLRQTMQSARITQDQLATRLGVSRALVGHWVSGRRSPDEEAVASVARALRVDATWLKGGQKMASETPSTTWSFPSPIPGQRDFGNANVWTVPADVKTEVREAGQNIQDASDGKSKAIVMRFRVIELQGNEVHSFWDAAGWSDLEKHLEAAAREKGKLARKLSAGLRRVRSNGDRLLLLRIDDFGTTGLVGDEVGNGPFAALVRNNLDSQKQSTSAGGSFGLGKAAHWRCSDISTVFFNTVTDGYEARVIARAELTYHSPKGGKPCAGPGWFGTKRMAEYAESVQDKELASRLYLERDPLPAELQSRVATSSGTSILVVAFQNPASETPDDAGALIQELEREIALNFWPAIRSERMAAIVEHQVGGHIRETRIVDPRRFVPEFCSIYDKFLANGTVEAFDQDGDVVSAIIPIKLPRCKHEHPDVLTHPAVDAEATLVVGLVDPEKLEDESEGLSGIEAAHAKARRKSLNSVAMIRGPRMVTQYLPKEGVLVGARPFFGILLAGDAGKSDERNAFVEQFLRAAEPPAHDRWTFTDDLREMYDRGAKSRLDEFLGAKLTEALRRVLRVPSRDESSGPPELIKLLNLGRTGDPLRELAARHGNTQPKFLGDRWSIKADIFIKRRERPSTLVIEPYVALNAETGRPQRVHWETLDLVPADGVRQEGNRFVTDGTCTRFTYKGVTDPKGVPVDASHCTARLALVLGDKL